MTGRTLLLTLVAILASVVFADKTLSACSCSGGSTPCMRGESGIIFRGQVESILQNPARSRLKVLEVFAGKLGATVDLPFRGSSCDIVFVVGDEYLVYASDFKGVISTNMCSGTSPVQHVQEDLRYLRSSQFTNPGNAQIVGESVASQGVSAAGIRVSARRGKTVLTAVTDLAGHFAIDAPPGSYMMSAEAASGTAIRLVPTWVALAEARGCRPVALYVDRDTRLTGRVLDAQRRAIANVPVDVVRLFRRWNTIQSDETLRLHAVRTDATGAFVLRGMPPGLYAVVINPWQDGGALGIPTVYAPGVTEIAKAQQFEVRESVVAQPFDIQLPVAARLVPVNGIVRDATGQAAPGVEVTLIGPNGSDSIFSDEFGRFALVAAAGGTYTVMAHSNGLPAGGVSIKIAELSDKTPPTVLTLQPFRTQ